MIYEEIMDWNRKENGTDGDAIVKEGIIAIKQ